MTKTWDLYRCSPLLWAGLEYEDALEFRIEKAEEAKLYYKTEGRKYHWLNDSEIFKSYTDKYLKSQKAVDFNRELLDEINEERREVKRNEKETEVKD